MTIWQYRVERFDAGFIGAPREPTIGDYGTHAQYRTAHHVWKTESGVNEAALLNELGRMGWELVAAHRTHATETVSVTCYFKRPKP